MKALSFVYSSILFIAVLLSSCSSDSSDPEIINPQNVFSEDLPQRIDIDTFKYNSEGFVEKISSRYQKGVFEYPLGRSSNVVTLTVTDFMYPQDDFIATLEIGDNGFVKKAIQTRPDKSFQTWDFAYISSISMPKVMSNSFRTGIS